VREHEAPALRRERLGEHPKSNVEWAVSDDWKYCFGFERPAEHANNDAGIDVSPAVRAYLQLKGRFGRMVQVIGDAGLTDSELRKQVGGSKLQGETPE
jgi:hypothetical protein